MTELSTEPVAVQAVPAAPPPPPPDTPPAVAPVVKEVEHTPGGWPIVPLALSTANSTVGTVAAASLVGGPVAAAVAATGMVVLGTFAAARSRKPDPRREARRTAARAAGRSAARKAGLHTSGTGTRGSGGRSTGSRAGGSGGRSGKTPGHNRRTTGTATGHTGTAAGRKPGSKTSNSPAKRAAGGAGKAAGKAGQVKALRDRQKAAAGSRAGQRTQTTAARRAVADARRNTKATAGTARSGKRPGLAGRLMGGAAWKARAARDATVAKSRARRDVKTGATIAAQRAGVRKAPARKAARRVLRRSAARFHGRRLLAALLALPVGLLGCLTTPIGRKFDIPWLMYPGRRLYRRMAQTAAEQRAERDEATRQQQREQEAAADAEAAEDGTGGIADQVERPAANVPTPATSQVSEGENVSINTGFKFEDHAMDMCAAANTYEPDGCMEILAMVEGLPTALTFVADVMKILAERSDSEFPLEKEVADGFNDIFGAVMSAVAVAEDMGPLFRQAHAQDIARHEDPRNGSEAEKGWNV
ncbi:hypothetical protein [Streptomyces torulosus]|uniref:hypothetical protein n=1 Tax=Streptomyces torulosus TaxID=68276 RepID=UPI0006EBDA75|nr:hypothetical protein [Streptomyces torulosus]